MTFDTWKATDTMGDEQDYIRRVDERAAEAAREQRWTAFVKWLKGDRPKSDSEWSTMLFHIYANMRGQGDWHHERINAEIVGFQQAEGWDGVFNALARAYREQQS